MTLLVETFRAKHTEYTAIMKLLKTCEILESWYLKPRNISAQHLKYCKPKIIEVVNDKYADQNVNVSMLCKREDEIERAGNNGFKLKMLKGKDSEL